MATESVANPNEVPPFLLSMDLINEGDKLVIQARAILECLGDGISLLDDPEHCVPELTWIVRDHLHRLGEIVNSRAENGAAAIKFSAPDPATTPAPKDQYDEDPESSRRYWEMAALIESLQSTLESTAAWDDEEERPIRQSKCFGLAVSLERANQEIGRYLGVRGASTP